MENINRKINDEVFLTHNLLYNKIMNITSNAAMTFYKNEFDVCWVGFRIREDVIDCMEYLNYIK